MKIFKYKLVIILILTSTYQVNTSCESLENIQQKSWFVLPPLQEYYYKKQNPFYKPLPKFREDCLGEVKNVMKFLYPT